MTSDVCVCWYLRLFVSNSVTHVLYGILLFISCFCSCTFHFNSNALLCLSYNNCECAVTFCDILSLERFLIKYKFWNWSLFSYKFPHYQQKFTTNTRGTNSKTIINAISESPAPCCWFDSQPASPGEACSTQPCETTANKVTAT